MVYVQLLTLGYNSGLEFSFTQAMAPAMGILFFAMGSLIKNAKRNYMVGIRTPWTLASDSVWDKTHKLGAPLFRASGAITFLGVIFPDLFIYLVLVPVLSSTAILFVYSYLEFKKTEKTGKN